MSVVLARTLHVDTRCTHMDGTVVDVSVAISPIRDDHGAVVGTTAVARNISDRKRAEARQQATDEY